MKTCGYCGQENPDEAAVCGGCGQTRWVEPKPPIAPTKPLEQPAVSIPEEEWSNAAVGTETGEEPVLCRSCLHENAPEAESCVKCGAPVGLVVTVGQWEPVLGQHYAMDRGAERRPRTIILLTLWLILGVGIASESIVVITILDGFQGVGPGAAVLLLACVGLIGFKIWLLHHATRRYLTQSQEPATGDGGSSSAPGGRIPQQESPPTAL